MYHIIVNPSSRSGRGIELWNKVEPELKKRNIEYEVYFSKKAGDVCAQTSLLSKLEEEEIRLILLGGDGTVNEAIQGMEPLSKFILGYIPTGSSNDLARDLNMSCDPLDMLDHILTKKETVSMDIGVLHYDSSDLNARFGDRRFSVSCGIGFDAAVCEEAMHSKIKDTLNRIGLGKLTYGGIGVKQVFGAPKTACKLVMNDPDQTVYFEKIFFIAVMNHKYEGGGFKFCPTADYTDGIFNLCTIGDISPMTFMRALPFGMKGTHYRFKGIEPYSAKKIHIETDIPLWVHTDGEVVTKATSITVQPAAEQLRIIV